MVNDEKKYFIYNGVKSSDFGIWASGSDVLVSPKKRYEQIDIPGRNGALFIEDGSFENETMEFDCFIPEDFVANYNDFKKFLYRQKGYKRLELAWLPDEYRLAMFTGDISPTVKMWDAPTQFDLSFNCKPQRYLKSGEEPIWIIPIYPTGTTTMATPFYTLNDSDTIDSLTIAFKVEKGTAELYTSIMEMRWYTDASTYTSTYFSALDEGHGWVSKTYTGDAADLVGWKIVLVSQDGDLEYDDIALNIRAVCEIDGVATTIEGIWARTVEITNPTGYECRPEIVGYGTQFPVAWMKLEDGEGWTFTCTDYSSLTDKIYLDCENEYLYYEDDGVKTNLTGHLTIAHTDGDDNTMQPNFPRLAEGTSTLYVYLTSALDDVLVAVYPHWFTI